MKSTEQRWLKGIIPPMVTPLSDEVILDLAGLERLVDHLLRGGVHGLFILGSTGEGPSLCSRLRRELISATVENVAGRVPVLVGVTDVALSESVRLAEYAADAGADAVVASAPFYFKLSQEELCNYIERLAESIPLPLVIYNIPQLTKTRFAVESVRRLLDLGLIAGIKDSSGNMVYFHQLLQELDDYPDVSLFMGPEEMLLDGLSAGAHGGVCGGANLFPRLLVDLYEANQRQDFDRARQIHRDVMEISNLLYHINGRGSAFVNAIKGSLAQCGICEEVVAPPFLPFDVAERQLLEHRLRSLSRLESDAVRSVVATESLGHLQTQDGHDPLLRRHVHGNSAKDTSQFSAM